MTREQQQVLDCMTQDFELLQNLHEMYETELTEPGDMPDQVMDRIGSSYEEILNRFKRYHLHIKQEVGRVRTLSKAKDFPMNEEQKELIRKHEEETGGFHRHFAPGAGEEESIDG